MKKFILGLGLALAASSCASAGALFDDYLNYVRPGTGTGQGRAWAVAKAAQPIGQSFTLPAGTGEIFRIGIRPAYDTWGKDEKVTVTLYDSADKKQKLGEYTISESNCHVKCVSIWPDKMDTDDFVLYYRFRKPTEGKTQFYFEITPSGGDGAVSFFGFDTDAYLGGQAYGTASVKDIAFECHVKPVADKAANLKKFFNEQIDLTRPDMVVVKAAVDASDWEKAIAEMVKVFDSNESWWEGSKEFSKMAIDPQADTKTADEYMNFQIVDPLASGVLMWKPDRSFGKAFTDTGNEKYARKAIDLRMDIILSSPNPTRAGLPWYFSQWNDRDCGGRCPGYGGLMYARLYNYKGWTNDEKLVLYSWFEENAAFLYGRDTGANWGAEGARGCYEFAVKFPQWKKSKEYVEWGTVKLAEIVLGDIRSEGTSSEAAIKYHAMVARRVKGMLEDHIRGDVKLSDDIYARVLKATEKMYEHMAYTLQPNNYVVMCGDSWYENFTEEVASAAKLVNRPDILWLATQGKEGKAPTEISKVYPEAGYFIMRSDVGGAGKNYTDAKQLFVHNGGWFGSHGHWDLLSINLYGFGRTLVIDPGQYGTTPPPGFDAYWESRIHSMLVKDGGNVKREPGPNNWLSNGVMDWLDGKHFGYRSIDYVRRRVVYIKPGYFLVDDYAKGGKESDYAQVWNLTDPNAKIDQATGAIETTFANGGNVLILNQDPSQFTVEEAKGMTSTKDTYPETKIFRLHKKTAEPRFASLLYPYKAGSRPNVEWSRINPDDALLGSLFYSVRVKAGQDMDWAVFGETGKLVSYRNGSHKVDADFAVVRMTPSAQVKSFSWVAGKQLSFDGKILAKSDSDVYGLAVDYAGPKLVVEAKDAHASLAVRTGGAKTFVVNGKTIAKPVVKAGMFYPFADMPYAIVADSRNGFEKITTGEEWGEVGDPNSWFCGYLHHETDPGRCENGNYIFNVAKAGRYSVEVFLPKMTKVPSDAVEYSVPASGMPAKVGGAVTAVRNESNGTVVTLNQQTMAGWVKLGDFDLPAGQFKINAKNATKNDGIYFTADAMRLVGKK